MAAATTPSAIPAQVALVRIASRENQGSRSISPSSAEHGEHARAGEHDPVALGRAQAIGPVPVAVDRHAAREIHVGEATPVSRVARDDQRALHASGARAERLHAVQSEAVRPVAQRGRLALTALGIRTPDPEEQAPGGDRRRASAASSTPGADSSRRSTALR